MALTTFNLKITSSKISSVKKKKISVKNSYKTITKEEDLINVINIIKEGWFFSN